MADGPRAKQDRLKPQNEASRRSRSKPTAAGACTDAARQAPGASGASPTSIENLFGDYSEQTGAFFG
jgi:hypothetical protein